jgi:hypothetical protein
MIHARGLVHAHGSGVRRLIQSLEVHRVTSVPYDYEDEPDEDEEPQDGSHADDSQWFAGE